MALTNDQKVTYLANVILIARADGKLSPHETDAIESIQKSIGAKKTELNKAHKVAEAQNYEMSPVGHWTDKTKNLEDIIYVSMIDGSVDQAEKPLIIGFARQINVSQDQINIIVRDVRNVISSGTSSALCPSCRAKIQSNVKFCPECGASIADVAEKKAVSVSYEIPKSGIVIEFAESTASGFAHAVQNQQIAPINATCLKGKTSWYIAAWPSKEIIQAMKLVENLKGMRNRKVYVDGEEFRWDEVFGFAWCARQRNTAYRPMEYCFGLDEKRLNIWGCKQAQMDWAEWSDWLGYGSFSNKGLLKNQVCFVFDKNRIRHELETNLFKCRFCPHLRFDLIEAVLKELPDEVTPSEKGPWVYKRDYNETPESIKIKVESSEGGYTYTDEYYSSGVAPKSVALGLGILRKAFQSCGFDIPEVKGILEFKG